MCTLNMTFNYLEQHKILNSLQKMLEIYFHPRKSVSIPNPRCPKILHCNIEWNVYLYGTLVNMSRLILIKQSVHIFHEKIAIYKNVKVINFIKILVYLKSYYYLCLQYYEIYHTYNLKKRCKSQNDFFVEKIDYRLIAIQIMG